MCKRWELQAIQFCCFPTFGSVLPYLWYFHFSLPKKIIWTVDLFICMKLLGSRSGSKWLCRNTREQQFSVPVNLCLPLSFLHWDGKNIVTSRAACLCFAGKILEEGTACRCNLSSPPAKLAQEGWLLVSMSKEQSSFLLINFPWPFLELLRNGKFDTSEWKSNCT